MITFQHLFLNFAELLIATRYRLLLNKKLNMQSAFGIKFGLEHTACNQQMLKTNWRVDQCNEMIVQFFLESDGMSFLVEEWSLIQENETSAQCKSQSKTHNVTKQLILWLRSAITMMTLTTLFQQEQQYMLTHSMLFYNKNTKKRSDWLNENSLEVKKISTKLSNQTSIQLTVAQQGKLQQNLIIKSSNQELPIYRGRFNSDCLEPKVSYRMRKMTMDTHSSSSNNLLNKSYVSIYSKKDEVELLVTQEEAQIKILDSSWKDEDYEIQFIINDKQKEEIFMSSIQSAGKLNLDQRKRQQEIMQVIKEIKINSQNKRRKQSIQLSKILYFIEQQ